MTDTLGEFIYSISERECDWETWRGNEIEKIGSTNDLPGRLYEHNVSSTFIDYVYNWYFKITDLNKRTLLHLEKEEIHVILGHRHVEMGGGTEFFRKDLDKPAYQIIREYLDRNNILYKFVHENDILPKKRVKLHKHLKSEANSKNLRDYQLHAHSLMENNDRYTFIFPAGTGKGFTFVSYIKNHPGKYLILVPGTESREANSVKGYLDRHASIRSQWVYTIKTSRELYVIVSTYHSSKSFKTYRI